MRILSGYIRRYAFEAIMGPLFKLLEALFELFVPLVVAEIIDRGIDGGNKRYIIFSFAVLVLLGIIGIVCSVTAQYFAAKASVRCVSSLRESLYSHIMELSLADADKAGVPTLITRLTGDLNQVQSGLNLALRLLLRSPFVVFGAVIMAYTIDRRASMIFLGVILLLTVVIVAVMSISVPAYKKVQNELDGLTETVRENLTGVRVIRAFGKEDYEHEKFSSRNGKLNSYQQSAGAISALMNPMTFVILNCGIVVLLYCSGLRVENGSLTTGQTVALYNYMTQILTELVKFANLIVSITKAVACMNRVEGILKLDPGMTFAENDVAENVTAPAVEFENVSLKYPSSSVPAISNISFTVNKGDTVGIIGGTGSGKTTLVNLIPRLYDATDGEVRVNGVNVKEYPAKALRDKIGYVLQKAVLFSGTVDDNLRFGKPDADADEEANAISAAAASDVIEAKENGLASEVGHGGRNFSGGQRQRLTIARALVRKPEILILDDSASALDFATEAKLREGIAALDYRPTVFIVSQRTSSIMHADRILVLDDGRLVGMGRHRELLDTCEVYREIYESQYGEGAAK